MCTENGEEAGNRNGSASDNRHRTSTRSLQTNTRLHSHCVGTLTGGPRFVCCFRWKSRENQTVGAPSHRIQLGKFWKSKSVTLVCHQLSWNGAPPSRSENVFRPASPSSRRRCEAPSGGMEKSGVTTTGSGDAPPLLGRGRHRSRRRRRRPGLVDPLLPTHQFPERSKAITRTTEASSSNIAARAQSSLQHQFHFSGGRSRRSDSTARYRAHNTVASSAQLGCYATRARTRARVK